MLTCSNKLTSWRDAKSHFYFHAFEEKFNGSSRVHIINMKATFHITDKYVYTLETQTRATVQNPESNTRLEEVK